MEERSDSNILGGKWDRISDQEQLGSPCFCLEAEFLQEGESFIRSGVNEMVAMFDHIHDTLLHLGWVRYDLRVGPSWPGGGWILISLAPPQRRLIWHDAGLLL